MFFGVFHIFELFEVIRSISCSIFFQNVSNGNAWHFFAFFWVILWRLSFICQRFGTHCLFTPTCLWRWNRQCGPKCRHIKLRHQIITQKKAYNILNMAEVWNQEYAWHYLQMGNIFSLTKKCYVTLSQIILLCHFSPEIFFSVIKCEHYFSSSCLAALWKLHIWFVLRFIVLYVSNMNL